ncbi:MAG: ATPase, partial [Nitrospinae bacterium]|nr:ATPase [Nitrospinota bacterium]
MEYDISTISAALAIGLTAAATSYAQAKIGAAAVAAL